MIVIIVFLLRQFSHNYCFLKLMCSNFIAEDRKMVNTNLNHRQQSTKRKLWNDPHLCLCFENVPYFPAQMSLKMTVEVLEGP